MSASGRVLTMIEADKALELAARRSYGKLVSLVTKATGDLDLAEEAVAQAFNDALPAWREHGVPDLPDAWLLTAARRRWTDMWRRTKRQESLASPSEVAQLMPEENDSLPDERLSLLFACAHPAIEPAVRTPLLLRCVLGVSIEQIASAMLASPAAMKQRLTRGKAKIRDAGIRLEVPGRDELSDRLNVALAAVYAAFNTAIDYGDTAPSGLDREAIDIARLMVELLPEEPEAIGLLSLCLYLSARFDARIDSAGRYVPLDQQDSSLWDWSRIEEAEALLRRAAALGRPGRFQIEASIQSTHVERPRTGSSDWTATLRFYDLLMEIAPSLGASVSRAATLLQAQGPEACIEQMQCLQSEWGSHLDSFQPYWAVLGEALLQTGQKSEATAALTRAIGLSNRPAVRDFLLAKCDKAL